MSEEGHGIRVVRSLIAGGIGMAGTLTGIGGAGLIEDFHSGALACAISFFVGFVIRLGIEYGVSVPTRAP